MTLSLLVAAYFGHLAAAQTSQCVLVDRSRCGPDNNNQICSGAGALYCSEWGWCGETDEHNYAAHANFHAAARNGRPVCASCALNADPAPAAGCLCGTTICTQGQLCTASTLCSNGNMEEPVWWSPFKLL
eukprot:GEMP01071923.1.p1 GENE.GEMP01071923.1~~GEMP01071923.1.p1  ORF type:complete len:130 (+),score=18.18 GEMP01071923.1:66-455(+)